MKRLGSVVFWCLVGGCLIYIFFWPSVTLKSQLFKGFLSFTLIGAACVDMLQSRIKEVEERLQKLEGRLDAPKHE